MTGGKRASGAPQEVLMVGFKSDPLKLTKREQEILDCLLDGLSYKQTAEKLCIVLTTLYTHRNNIFQKKGVGTLQQLLVNEYKRLLARSATEQEFNRIRKEAYQLIVQEIQKKLKEV